MQDVVAAATRLSSQDADEHIYVFQGDPDSSNCEDIVTILQHDQNIKLVIIETLDDLLKMNDIKENTAARHAFDKFNTQLMIPFGNRASFLALHHMKKAEVNFAGDGLLGASTIRGRTDAKIYLAQATPEDERRLIWSTKRIGRAIPKTFLVFDTTTGKSELGETIADAKRISEVEEKKAAQTKLFDILLRHSGIEHKDLLNNLSGSFKNRNALIREAVLDGSVIKSGRGVKGSPLTYRMAEVPMEPSNAVSKDTKAEKENLNELAKALTVH